MRFDGASGLSAGHSATVSVLSGLADAYARSGDATGALASHERLWATLSTSFGDDFPGAATQLTAVAAATDEVAAGLRQRLRTLDGEEAQEAEKQLECVEAAGVELLRRALALREYVHGDKHAEVSKALQRLGNAMCLRVRLSTAGNPAELARVAPTQGGRGAEPCVSQRRVGLTMHSRRVRRRQPSRCCSAR
jgi:hypothetical protein